MTQFKQKINALVIPNSGWDKYIEPEIQQLK